MTQKSRFLVLSSMLVLLFACVSGDQQRGTRHFNVISIEDEWQLGASLSRDIAGQVQLVAEPTSLTYLRAIADRMTRQSTMANLSWEFHIIASPEVNAFAVPGGHVYLTTGTIAAARNASELAALVAHEVGHGVDRNVTAALSSQFGLKELARVARGQDDAGYKKVLSQITSGSAFRFSREAESEANTLAVKWLQPAGYDPNGLVALFHGLQSQPPAQKYLAAHPSNAAVAEIQSQIGKLPKKSGLLTDEPEFRAMKERLQAKP